MNKSHTPIVPQESKWAVLAGVALISMTSSSFAHLPSYEGERVRNSGHFETSGFSQPVRGECDVNAVGPTDPNAGSANIYLGAGNTPPNFFCLYATQDDWSFKYPVEIIEKSRTPAPDYVQTLDPTSDPYDTSYLEEGYIPCDQFNPDPFQCPREIRNPVTGQVTALPGNCIDTAKPDDPALWREREEAEANGEEFLGAPDGVYHCAIQSGSPRPRTSSVLMSTLTGVNDVDWGIYRYKPAYREQPIVAAPQVPACEQNLKQFVSFAYMGPLGLRDARTGEELFTPVGEVGDLPDDVIDNIPNGYGIRVNYPDKFNPRRNNPRIGYASGFAQNAWLLAPHSIKECIDSFEKCLAEEELRSHYDGNDIFFINEQESVDLYLAWWVNDPSKYRWQDYLKRYKLYDVSITTGVIDQFLLGDFISIGTTGPFTANGRYVHGRCSDPRPGGRVDMTIETN
ncbi:hypothetical protein EZV61_13735 [Corallincola luteus]|uniref:Uncharacterized protein n=1 Tax=Corallincola luteus TaxID=1775177 RepID=A0ABY2AIG2_9GAMM|nr:hypothetical protein [Corallincola luteus]TCI02414.1 hypothetical protein EZV61_13735 [Corallincola luteus]